METPARVEVRRTPSPPQGAYYCTYLKDPCHQNPEMKALWVGQPAEVRQRQKTALIALISKDNKNKCPSAQILQNLRLLI